ncbi:13073_t:CDS:2 [Funneliformis caledonium]|uniref:13073_t:CDS:1 n=1 Tax=Funneliformis caledonium TaxID=1117310 RepID=A0A9N9B0H8_9GLOM|nr:13073_t:CDS:2 [Funneliformis caledonium]
MILGDLFGIQRKSEPKVVLMMRLLTLLLISLWMLIIDAKNELPTIKTSDVQFDRRTEKETCMRYVISPQYNKGAYRGYFSLNDNSTLFTFPKLNEERLHSLTLQMVADFNTS